MGKENQRGNHLSQGKYRQGTLHSNGNKREYKNDNATHFETFSSGKSSSYMIKEFRRQKLEYEEKTGYSLTRREIGNRF